MSNEKGKIYQRLCLIIIMILFVMWSLAFVLRTSFIAIDGIRYFSLFDDAMISARYAWNFAHGIGLVWNSGEYVEGYTNLLMTLLMSVPMFIFGKSISILLIQIFGIFLILINAILGIKIARLVYGNKLLMELLVFLCIISYYPLVFWSIMGMETGLLTLCLLLSVFFTLKSKQSLKPHFLYLSSFSLGFAFLTRPDSIIFFGITILFFLLDIQKISFEDIVVFIIIYTIFVLGQTMFRYWYYGEILPNTYTLKATGMPLIPRIFNGYGFVKQFLIETKIALIIVFISITTDYNKTKLYFLTIFAAALSYQIWIGGDPWTYWRILAPAMPFVFIILIQELSRITSIIVHTKVFLNYLRSNLIFSKNSVSQILLVLMTLLVLLAVNRRFLSEVSLVKGKPYTTEDNKRNINIAIALSHLTTTDATVGVFWAGSLPYYLDRFAIDFLGKSDKYIAHLAPDISGAVAWDGMTSVPGHNKYDLTYSIQRLQPTYVDGFKWGRQDLSKWAETKYVKTTYKGVTIYLLANSPSVYWNRINSISK